MTSASFVRRKSIHLRSLVWLALLLLPVLSAFATDLRGRVVGWNPYANAITPLPGVPATLFVQVGPNNYNIVRAAVSGPDGMYYLPGIAPGSYVLQVGRANYPLGVVQAQFQDIPPIRVQ